MAMLGLMQQLSYNGASIRFEDAGITAKALEYAGKQQGVDGKQFAQSLKGMAPMMLAQLNIPELQTRSPRRSTPISTIQEHSKCPPRRRSRCRLRRSWARRWAIPPIS